jgi:hypothetical protein
MPAKRMRSIAGPFLLLVLTLHLCFPTAFSSLTPITIDPDNGVDVLGGGSLRTFGPLCGLASNEYHDVVIQSSTTAAKLLPSCVLNTVASIGCSTATCEIDFEAANYFIVPPDSNRPTLIISRVKLTATAPGTIPIFVVPGNTTLSLNALDAASFSTRPFAKLTSGAHLEIKDCTKLAFTEPSGLKVEAISLEESTLSIEDSTIRDTFRVNSPMIRSSSSSVIEFTGVRWISNVFQTTNASFSAMIESSETSVSLTNSEFSENLVNIGASLRTVGLFALQDSQLSVSLCTFFSNDFGTMSPSYVALGSVISLDRSTYSIVSSNFSGADSKGCNFLRASSSSGSIGLSLFENARIGGSPSSNASGGLAYPPYESPTIAAVVCLTRDLSNLMSDFGVLFSENDPEDPSSNNHRLYGNFFKLNYFAESEYHNPSLLRSAMSEIDPFYLLHAADVWGSNVRLLLQDNSHQGQDPNAASIRVDACNVTISDGELRVPGWVDFGSSILIESSAASVHFDLAAIYGAAPGRVSTYRGVSSSSLMELTDPTIFSVRSIITGGIFDNLDLLVNGEHNLTFCCTFPENVRYLQQGPLPFQDALLFKQSQVVFSTDTNVTLARKTTPWIMEDNCQLIISGRFHVPRLGASVIQSPLVRFYSTANVFVIDLLIQGDVEFHGGPNLFFNPSRYQNTFHGLDIDGSLTCTTVDPVLLSPINLEFDLLLDPIYQGLPSLYPAHPNGTIPVFKIRDDMNGCSLPGAGTYVVTQVGQITAGNYQAAERHAAFYFSKVFVQCYWHPTRTSVICDFPIDMRDSGIILADCAGFLVSPLGFQCAWLTERRLRVTTSGVILDVNLDVILNRYTLSVENTITLLPSVKPTVFLQTVFDPVGPHGFTLDAHLSSTGALPGPDTSITWTAMPSGTLSPLLSNAAGKWNFSVDHTYVQGSTYTFTALSTNTWTTRTPISGSVSATSAGISDMEVYCFIRSVRIDSSSKVYLYENTQPVFSLLSDPACDGFGRHSVQSIVWKLILPSHTLTYPSRHSTLFTMPRYSRSDLGISGALLTLEAALTYSESAVVRRASIELIFKIAEPSLSTKHNYQVPRPVTRTDVRIETKFDADQMGIASNKRIVQCPNPAISIMRGGPFAAPSPIPSWSYLCFGDDGSTVYDLPVVLANNSTSSAMVVKVDPNWHSGEHLFSSKAIITAPGYGYDVAFRSQMKMGPVASFEPVEIHFADFTWKEFDHELENDPYIVLAVKFTNGSLCLGCVYHWTSEPSDAGYSGSVLFFNPTPSGDIVYRISVSVTYPTPSGFQTAKAQMSIKTGTLIGKGQTFPIFDPVTSTYELHATDWSTNHLGLRYLFGYLDCRGNYRLAHYLTMSPKIQNVRIVAHQCPAPDLEYYVIDGIGSIARSFTSLYPFASPSPIDWNENPSMLSNFVTNFTQSVADGDYTKAIDYLNRFEELASMADTPTWTSQRSTLVPLITDAIEALIDVPYAELMVLPAFSNFTILQMMQSDALAGHLLQIALATPTVGGSKLSNIRCQAAVYLVEAVYRSYFDPKLPASGYLERFARWFTQVPRAGEIWSSLHSILTAPFSRQTFYAFSPNIRVGTHLLDVQRDWNANSSLLKLPLISANKVEISPSFLRRPSILGQYPWVEPLLPASVMLFSDLHLALPLDPVLAPIRTVVRIEVTLGNLPYTRSQTPRTLERVEGWVEVTFPVSSTEVPNYDQLVCAVSDVSSAAWRDVCTKTIEPLELVTTVVTCRCPASGVSSVQLSLALLAPSAFCSAVVPSGGNFACVGGNWVSEGSLEAPLVIVPPGGITVIGNLTVDTLTISGLGSTVTVTGCTKIGNSITIELTLEELEALIESGELSSILLTSTGCDITDLKNIPITVTVNAPGRCEKVSVTSEASSTTLTGIFTVDQSNCKKKSKTWWIVLLSVLGGVIVLAAIVALLATFTPLKHVIRPHAKRAEEANTYYIQDTK